MRRHPSCRLSAIVSRDQGRRGEIEDLGARWFPDPDSLISSNSVDAIVIATPHRSHPDLSTAALVKGLHVLCEKPLAIRASDADRIVEVAQTSGRTCAVVFQHRSSPALLHIKALLSAGEIGKVLRAEIIETFPRPSDYYSSAPWRGTFAGEGGGVLVNQAPHLLDRYIWLFGQPTEVSAATDTRSHPIEVEDTASLLLRHSDGAHGTITATTAPSPMMSVVSVVAEHGTIQYSDGVLTTVRKSTRGGWTRTESATPAQTQASMFSSVYDNFTRAAAGLENPWVSAAEARRSVDLANAAYLSSDTGSFQQIPSNRAEFDALLVRNGGLS